MPYNKRGYDKLPLCGTSSNGVAEEEEEGEEKGVGEEEHDNTNGTAGVGRDAGSEVLPSTRVEYDVEDPNKNSDSSDESSWGESRRHDQHMCNEGHRLTNI